MVQNGFNVVWTFLFLVGITVVSGIVLGGMYSGSSGNVALIQVDGMISSESSFGTRSAISDTLIKNLRDAEMNPSIKVIVLDINSPGGSVVASKEVAEFVGKMKKPTICRIREIGTSGAYWVASYCDKIIADEFSLVGSVGVTGSYLEFSGLMEKYGVNYVELVSGSEKETGSPYKTPSQNDSKKLNEMVMVIKEKFLGDVARNRNLNDNQKSLISEGGFFIGREGVELGLIDELGGGERTEAVVKELGNISSIVYYKYKDEMSFLDLFSGFSSASQEAGVSYRLKA